MGSLHPSRNTRFTECLHVLHGDSQGVLIYECKDNQEIKEFFLKLDQSVLDPVLRKSAVSKRESKQTMGK